MDELEKKFSGMYRKIGAMQGMDDLFSSIFSLLVLEPEDIAMDELAKKTGYSVASISNKVKILKVHGIVKKSRKPGSKKAPPERGLCTHVGRGVDYWNA